MVAIERRLVEEDQAAAEAYAKRQEERVMAEVQADLRRALGR